MTIRFDLQCILRCRLLQTSTLTYERIYIHSVVYTRNSWHYFFLSMLSFHRYFSLFNSKLITLRYYRTQQSVCWHTKKKRSFNRYKYCVSFQTHRYLCVELYSSNRNNVFDSLHSALCVRLASNDSLVHSANFECTNTVRHSHYIYLFNFVFFCVFLKQKTKLYGHHFALYF